MLRMQMPYLSPAPEGQERARRAISHRQAWLVAVLNWPRKLPVLDLAGWRLGWRATPRIEVLQTTILRTPTSDEFGPSAALE